MASPLREGSSGMIAKPHDNSQSDVKLNDHWELKQVSRDFSLAYFLLSTVKCGFGAQKSILARVIESASCRAFRPCHKFDNALHRPRDLRKSSRRIAGGAKAGLVRKQQSNATKAPRGFFWWFVPGVVAQQRERPLRHTSPVPESYPSSRGFC
jgi:hypothetical protein